MSTKKVAVGIVVAAVLFLIFGAACNSAARPGTSTPSISSPVAIATGKVDLPVVTTVAGPSMTTSQANAVRKAESYISYQAFSESGLVKQLKFEGYSDSDAKFAVKNITVDWTEQADKKAESYMSFQSFSRSGLIKQLKFEGFTQAQAEHGATSVGLK